MIGPALVAGLIVASLVAAGYVICIAVMFADDDPSDDPRKQGADDDRAGG